MKFLMKQQVLGGYHGSFSSFIILLDAAVGGGESSYIYKCTSLYIFVERQAGMYTYVVIYK